MGDLCEGLVGPEGLSNESPEAMWKVCRVRIESPRDEGARRQAQRAGRVFVCPSKLCRARLWRRRLVKPGTEPVGRGGRRPPPPWSLYLIGAGRKKGGLQASG